MDDEDSVRRLIDEAERILGNRWDEISSWLKDRQSLETIERLIATGRTWQILDQADVARAGAALASDINGVFQEAAQRVASRIGEVTDNQVVYDVTNSRAARAMQDQTWRLVGTFSNEQRQVIRDVLSNGTRRGDNPIVVARSLRDSIGLTPFQAQAVDNYRRALETGDASALDRELRDRRFDPTVRGLVDGTKTASPEQVQRMVDRYRQNYVNLRAETIAQTESTTAVHEGAEDAWHQAIDKGDIDADALVSTWHAAKDKRTRASHREMDGQERGHGEPFTSGNGATLRYPGDPQAPEDEVINCRCAKSTRIVA